MSYILDALRRADAERERGAVPSLHTQQYGALPGDDDAPDRPLLLIGIIVFLLLALGSALAWHFWGGSDATTRLVTQGTVSAPLAPTATAIAPSAPGTSPAIAPLPPASLAIAAPAAASAASSPTAPLQAQRELKRRPVAAAAHPSAPDGRHMTRAGLTPASSPAPTGAELPDSLRRELPALAFGGASYSKDPASRMVIFNGRVFHEGDTLAPQLVLQQIKLKSVVFGFKGYRYELAF